MKYCNADVIFPEDLLKEIQKYVQGEMVYVPNPQGVRKKWGDRSGYRKHLDQRNHDIRAKFREGLTIQQLTDDFCLSFDSIKKIVYSNP